MFENFLIPVDGSELGDRILAEREKADLVPLTTRGRSGASRWLYGSVAALVLHRVHSPILVLRTAAFEGESA